MFYTSNVNAACRDIDGGRVLLEHLSGYVQSPDTNGNGKTVADFPTLGHGRAPLRIISAYCFWRLAEV